MKFQKLTRILCLLLAVLVSFGAIVRPVEVQATVVGATAGLSYIAVEAVIPWLFSALSIGYLYSYGSDLYYSVKDAVSDWSISTSLGESLKAYSYGSEYYLDSSVVEAVASVVDSYTNTDFSTACRLGMSYSSAYILSYRESGDKYNCYYWGDSTPTYSYSGSSLLIKVKKPGVFYADSLLDFSSSPEGVSYTYGVSDGTFISIEAVAPSSLLDTDVDDAVEQLAKTGIWIVDTTPDGDSSDGGKKRYLPVIPSSELDSSQVEDTDQSNEVENPSNDSSSDFSTGSLIEFLRDFWTGFKTKMLEIPDILREIKELIKNLPETLTNIWNWLKTLPSVIYDSIVNALEYLFVPSDGYLDWRVEDLRTSFPLFDSIIGSAGILRNFFNFATTPPIIYIDLGASTSWDMGGRTVFIDMSWYAEYKPTMDLVISVFLWLLFLWRIFLALPGIISGTSGSWGSGSVESTKTSGCTDITIIR